MEEFLPALFFIIYIIFYLLGAGSKKKNQNPDQDFETESPKPKRSIFTEIERQLKEFEKKYSESQQPEADPVTEVETYKNPSEEYKPLSEQIELREYKPISSEVYERTYSNLEEGIIDKTHASKFEHHGGKSLEVATVEQEKKAIIFENISPRDAFVYSLIFDRKFFKI